MWSRTAKMAKAQLWVQTIGGFQVLRKELVFFYHLQLLKYSRMIVLVDTILMSTLQLNECCSGSKTAVK